MIKAGIVGGSGYVAGELLRILINHPEVEIDFVYSTTNAGQPVYTVHSDLMHTGIEFTNRVNTNADVVFLSLGHGNSAKFIAEHTFSAKTKIIDLSNDFRLSAHANFQGNQFIYGLPEMNKQAIINARNIANPGCFATAIQLALLPLAQAGLLNDAVHINAITGATGAGQSMSRTTHFSDRNNNISAYKVFKHQHLDEINESLKRLQPAFEQAVNFVPLRGDFSRGIFATAYTTSNVSAGELQHIFTNFYENAVFTHFAGTDELYLKQVVNTNYGFVSAQKIDGKIFITSVLDNLLKGAAGQAIQNMNLMFAIEETTGLKLKATYF